MSQHQQLKVTTYRKWGRTALLSAFLFFTFQSGMESSDSQAVSNRVKVVENYASKLDHGPLQKERQAVLRLEGQVALQSRKKKLNPSELEELELAKIKAQKYHQLMDLEERISLHEDEPSFPKVPYSKKAQLLRDEIEAIDKSRTVSH